MPIIRFPTTQLTPLVVFIAFLHLRPNPLPTPARIIPTRHASPATASGKSTLACALELELLQKGKRAFRLDGDNVRFGLNKDLGFSPQDREENIRRVGEVSHASNVSGWGACGWMSLARRAASRNADAAAAKAQTGRARIYIPKGLYQSLQGYMRALQRRGRKQMAHSRRNALNAPRETVLTRSSDLQVAKLVASSSTATLTAFISPYLADRTLARSIHDAAKIPFVEVFVDAPLAEVEKRDPKGLYKKARAGIIKGVCFVTFWEAAARGRREILPVRERWTDMTLPS
mgnify:FL=1